ncbi:hypothetical protein Lfu02_50600 [Longispora fulva]|uniref:Uncharacterized protein n=1 Tax=Longispora fulva TaxID=619741 RepID=A0A8J7KTR9_9ACTN|nr:hypothetical protein [Longispora fulva]MBG6141042.1 hypothetical protein [Longispora fulva]GIG60688.1 hypothetical protein Lfu02_50600 [Longispora fulva]
MRRVVFFEPPYGIGLAVAAGSGRSWMEQPGGDPVHAHLHVDVEGPATVPEVRLRSGTGFVRWPDLNRFAAALEKLARAEQGSVELAAGPGFSLTVLLRADGRLRAETTFGIGHHVQVDVAAGTRWDWHFGTREALPDLAAGIRAAVREHRPGRLQP